MIALWQFSRHRWHWCNCFVNTEWNSIRCYSFVNSFPLRIHVRSNDTTACLIMCLECQCDFILRKVWACCFKQWYFLHIWFDCLFLQHITSLSAFLSSPVAAGSILDPNLSFFQSRVFKNGRIPRFWLSFQANQIILSNLFFCVRKKLTSASNPTPIPRSLPIGFFFWKETVKTCFVRMFWFKFGKVGDKWIRSTKAK